jgi:hypothetical protein
MGKAHGWISMQEEELLSFPRRYSSVFGGVDTSLLTATDVYIEFSTTRWDNGLRLLSCRALDDGMYRRTGG